MGPGRSLHPTKCQRAFDDYLALAPARSLDALLEIYAADPAAPTHRLPTLQRWAERDHWLERAARFDEAENFKAAELERERQRLILQSGLSLPSERVSRLKEIYVELHAFSLKTLHTLQNELEQPPAGGSGSGLRFNPGMIQQLRGVLDDLARETGGRSPAAFSAQISLRTAEPELELAQLDPQELETLDGLLRKAAPQASQLSLWDSSWKDGRR